VEYWQRFQALRQEDGAEDEQAFHEVFQEEFTDRGLVERMFKRFEQACRYCHADPNIAFRDVLDAGLKLKLIEELQ
jgi:hypothetical protein